MNLLFSKIDPSILFLVGCGLLTVILLRRSYRYFGRRTRSRDQTAIKKIHRPTHKWDGAEKDLAALINRQKVEFYEITRETAARMDSKMIVLQQLLEKSQKQIRRMEELLQEASEKEVDPAIS